LFILEANEVALSPNSSYLVNTLEGLALLDSRYAQLTCVNVDSATGDTRGVFSLVFRAFDELEQRWVALKFYDIAPHKVFDRYRVDAFRREHSILQTLLGVRRCLQVGSAFSIFKLEIPQHGGAPLEIPCPYFAVEWLDDQVDHYFEKQDFYDALDKLQLFNDIVLSVEALHRNQVHHRDLKKDNLRATYEQLLRVVVAIDLGTAARLESPPLRGDYDNGSVGAPAYTAPEGICGLAGAREIARFTDIYALGCMLFELFNRDLFVRELFSRNSNYHAVLTVMGLAATGGATPSDKLSQWHTALNKHGQGVTPVSILAAGNSVPAAVAPLLDELVQSMTKIDYRARPHSLEFVRRRIQSAITCLKNDRACRLKVAANKARRAERIARIALHEQRMASAAARRAQDAK
jgi:serine/threonine protein kinase